jgi:hypothetical protein
MAIKKHDIVRKIEDNSAIAYLQDGTRFWLKDDMLHREDGPGRIYPDGKHEYWLDNVQLDRETFLDLSPHFQNLKTDMGVYVSPSFNKTFRLLATTYEGLCQQFYRSHSLMDLKPHFDQSELPMEKRSKFSTILHGDFNGNPATCMLDFFIEYESEYLDLYAEYFQNSIVSYWRRRHSQVCDDLNTIERLFKGV